MFIYEGTVPDLYYTGKSGKRNVEMSELKDFCVIIPDKTITMFRCMTDDKIASKPEEVIDCLVKKYNLKFSD